MFEGYLGALLIMLMRICDVSIGTFRTILVVQGRKYLAGMTGFVEVLIWVFAIRFIFQHLDNTANLFGYALGFGIGNLLGITFEQKIGLGYVQLNIISKFQTDVIANALRRSKYGVTILPGEGGAGGVAIIVCVVSRKIQKKVIKMVEGLDNTAFITVQSSLPYRGFVHGSRK
ncbi:MAG: DUF5698 domain-containing protein [Ignavibacteria bacterium]|nr:DUF5698 domain-containing protein [Ignavibacteria bacterium]